MSSIEALIEQLRTSHEVSAPDPHISERLADFTERTGFALPEDLKTFYGECGRAVLHKRYLMFPFEEILLASVALTGEMDWCPDSWYAICNVQDGNYIGIDLAKSPPEILDCDHEDVRTARVIALSFTEFVSQMLKSESPFWLAKSFKPYGRSTSPESPNLLRRVNKGFWNQLGPERGPDVCRIDGCARLNIAFSVYCRRHHYESVNKHPCPFDDEEQG